MPRIDSTIIGIAGRLAESQSLPAQVLLLLMGPIYRSAKKSYCTATADRCDQLSNNLREQDPERAAELHLYAAQMRDIAHRQ
jgi:hypothetical protein